MVARRCECGVPEHLRVVVRVNVDETGCDHATCGVDELVTVEVLSNGNDAIVAQGHIGHATGSTRAVDD